LWIIHEIVCALKNQAFHGMKKPGKSVFLLLPGKKPSKCHI